MAAPTIPLIENLNLLTSVDLSHPEAPGDPPIYHFLYASSLYGTFFGIYGRFDVVQRPATNEVVVQNLRMRILNYQGILNIGFERDPVYDTRDNIVDFWLQGASGEDEKVVVLNEVFQKGTRFRLGLNRVVMPMAGFSTSPDTSRDRGTPDQKEALFDTEFHYRDGIDNYHQLRRDGMAVTHRKMAGPRCISSKIYLIA